MARNVEIKARVSNVEAIRQKAAAVADKGPIEITQDDTFFRCESGRLKLRAFSSDEGELIFYRRADQQGPKESFYLLSPTSAPDTLRESLSLAYGQAGRVRKHRTLFLAGRTRIHLDQVEGLGTFLELEVVLEDGEAAESGIREAHILMERLGVQSTQLIGGAYVDLLAQGASNPSTQSGPGLGQERPGDIACGEKRMSDSVSYGGCQCGSIRYEISRSALEIYVCHCKECRKQAASAFGISVIVPRAAFRLTRGTPKFWSRATDAGHTLECAFCPDCGSRLWHQQRGSAETISVKGGS